MSEPALVPIPMEDLVSLCKRRGFIFPASEIYGGINGFWDYGPLGIELKNNIRDAWWNDMVRCPPIGPDGEPLSIVGLDSSIIQNPRVWEASGHVAGFNDPMVDCRESRARYRYDHLYVLQHKTKSELPLFAFLEGDPDYVAKKLKKQGRGAKLEEFDTLALADVDDSLRPRVIGPDAKEPGTLTEPRQFNLIFKTYVGAIQDEDSAAFLRPETAQGIFLNYKNVLDTSRVKIPFGIAQIGKAFRNEVTPRNYIFRSREFEQMEMEWFCAPEDARKWYEFWCNARKEWWKSIGLTEGNLKMRSHDQDELAHYAKEGAGTFDIEYRFPFTAPGYGELEGVAHRGNFDLTQHQTHSKTKLEYFEPETKARFVPHVIEPAAGLSRGVLAILSEAFTPDSDRPSGVYMKFHPRIAPIKAAIFPLVKKDGMPETAQKLYMDLRKKFPTQFDVKQTIGKRYARMDEAGTPFCFAIDDVTMKDQTVTVRHRDTPRVDVPERISLDKVARYVTDHIS